MTFFEGFFKGFIVGELFIIGLFIVKIFFEIRKKNDH